MVSIPLRRSLCHPFGSCSLPCSLNTLSLRPQPGLPLPSDHAVIRFSPERYDLRRKRLHGLHTANRQHSFRLLCNFRAASSFERRVLPCSLNILSLRPQLRFSSDHAVIRFSSERSDLQEKRLHGFHSAKRPHSFRILGSFRAASSAERRARKNWKAQRGNALFLSGAYCASGSSIAGLKWTPYDRLQEQSFDAVIRFSPERCDPKKKGLHGLHSARQQHSTLDSFRGASSVQIQVGVRKISRSQTGDGFHSGAHCASGSRVVGLQEQSFDAGLGMRPWKASKSEGVECGEDVTETGNDSTNENSSKRSKENGVVVGQDDVKILAHSKTEDFEFGPDAAKTRNDSTDEKDPSPTENGVVLGEDDVQILAQYMTRHNFVRVLEVSPTADNILAGARVLLLDKPGNVHSIHQKHRLLTGSYYDILAALPAVIPEGPIGILGLGAGTAARLIDHFWPETDIHAWELDPGVVQVARKYFDLEEIEWKDGTDIVGGDAAPITRRRNSKGNYGAWQDESDEVRSNLFGGMGSGSRQKHGKLRVHVGDALGADVLVEGGFAGIIVDLFAEGAVIPALQRVETWREIGEKLRPGGRIIVNCGGSCVEAVGKKDGAITMSETIAALAEAFCGELSVTTLRDEGDNSLALTGPTPDFQVWQDTLPECLRPGIEDFRAFAFWQSQAV